MRALAFAALAVAIALPGLIPGDERAARALSAHAQGRPADDPVWIDVIRLDLAIRPWQADYGRARAEIDAFPPHPDAPIGAASPAR